VRTALTAVDGITDIETNVEENSCSFTAPDGMDVAATLNEIVESGVKQVKDWKLAE